VAALVSIAITTWNSAATIERCLESVCAHDYAPLEVVIIDNASTDGTPAILERYRAKCDVVLNEKNVGFSAGQNQAIRRSRGEWVLSLNPDVMVGEGFIRDLVRAGESDSGVGTVCGKLLRWAPGATNELTNVLDSAGMYFLRNLRHLDRGSGEQDRGQYDQSEFVFGATGAAALYRRTMIEDVSVFGEFFDEDFFAYREDADLAWRAQIMGWKCLYVPTAVAWHVRRVTPERRSQLPLLINWHSVKNRFLMRQKNISPWLYWRLLPYFGVRDLAVVGYALLRDRRLFSAVVYPLRHRSETRRKREWIQAHRRVSDRELLKWFGAQTGEPAAASEQRIRAVSQNLRV
jgi:GT2 family glycosyltransferase